MSQLGIYIDIDRLRNTTVLQKCIYQFKFHLSDDNRVHIQYDTTGTKAFEFDT